MIALSKVRRLPGTLLAALLTFASWQAPAGEESCSSCSYPVTVSGEFRHHKADGSVVIEPGGAGAGAFREDLGGKSFAIAVEHLPAGRYSISVGLVELSASRSGERLFDVTAGETALAKDFDIFEAAGGARKACAITGSVPHEDDSLKGPLRLSFLAKKGEAKFNTLEVKDAAGAVVVSLSASELADTFTAAATKEPQVGDAPIWRDSSRAVKERAADLIRRMSLAEKVAQLKNGAPAIPRLGLPAYDYWNEALHGVANNGTATVFPEPIGGASSWNPQLLQQEGKVIGIEGRAKFNDYAGKHEGNSKWWCGLTFWTPNINIFRDPRWGRGQETFGEDPYLTGTLGVAFIKGMQGDDPQYMLAMACAKHYAVHSGPEGDRHRFNAQPSERDLYETYLPQFERAVREAHVGGVMGAYNSLYGVPCCASPVLLNDLLRRQWGFDGYVVSDCDAIGDIWRQHHYTQNPEEAAAAAVKAGCNLCCGGDYNALVRAVQKGLIAEKEIDEALYHTLWTRFRLGLFDPAERVRFSRLSLKDNDTEENRRLALEVARQSLVLLKNDGILPLDRSRYQRIAVIGPNAKSTSMLHGNYHGSASHPVSILNGIKAIAGTNANITYAQGGPITTVSKIAAWSRQDNDTSRPLAELYAEALNCASNADVIIYAGGITPAQEGEMYDRVSIELPEVQARLIQLLHDTGKPMVMVNCSGSAMALTWEQEHLPAILQAWYPGEEGGRAVGEVLFGEVNPSGHLPVTFYRSTADLPEFTDYSMTNRTYRYFGGTPLYAFGHGLSYSTFEYRSDSPKQIETKENGVIKVAFTVKNTGSHAGSEVAQVYYRKLNPAAPQARLSLCGFARIDLKPGKKDKVTVIIPADRLHYWDTVKKQYAVEPGEYELLVGRASDDIRLRLPLTVRAR
jgi:beta-glucosidase